jgi:hypothetical protein
MGPALDTRRPFTRADAVGAGLPQSVFRGSRFRRIFRGVYVDPEVADSPDLKARAALMLFDRTAYASHTSAARLLGGPLPPSPDEHVCVTHPRHRRVREGVRCHVERPDTTTVTTVRGMRTADAASAFRQLAGMLGLVDLVVVGDHLVRRRHVDLATLRAAVAAWPGHAGRLARRAAALVRDCVDSPMETRLRLLLVLAGIPEPHVNAAVRDADGTPLRRYDLSWPEVRVVVEFDGRHHVERVDQWELDLARREAMDDESVRLVVVTAAGIFVEPERTLERVWRVLSSRRLPGLPRTPRDEWRSHFPGR